VNGQFNSLKATEVVVSDTQSAPTSLAFPADTERLVDRLHGVECSGITFQVSVPSTPSVTRLPLSLARPPADSVEVTAASPGLFPTVVATFAAGRGYGEIADNHHQDVAVLGQGAAQQLGVRDLAGQPAVYIDGIPFTVVGILTAVRREASLLQQAIVPDRTALRYWGIPSNGSNAIVAVKPGSAAVVASELPVAILPTDPTRLAVPRLSPNSWPRAPSSAHAAVSLAPASQSLPW
jgi:putative ABC transport system permease protein